MDQELLDSLHGWFERYVRTFDDMDEEALKNIRLKVVHTRKVCEAMALLAVGEGLSPEETRIADAVALLHDVGRFPQFRRWRTFRDAHSDNHARLSVDAVRAERVLEALPERERLLIEEAVRFHNLKEVPPRLKGDSGLFLKLIRDADKLDIWRVFLEHYRSAPAERASAVSLGFPERPEISPDCLGALDQGRVVDLATVRTLNDFRLLQISWVYDMNFPTSYRLLAERALVPGLAATFLLAERDKAALEAAVARAEGEIARRSVRRLTP